ncbi:phenylalanine--tRNA ligase subunit alpha [Gammaproteobacteria bacterium]|nr:phenylalanine--tRNA ligase subunit alpha [Gammaproteobacteria bacterium]
MSSSSDINYPKIYKTYGSLHPINQIKAHIIEFLNDLGFEIIDGPEVETEEFNFDMLNIKKSHPARQMHDTFYLNGKSNLLRTHTSPVQIRGLLERKPPVSFISGGKVYRKDDDATHLPMFHQIEGIHVSHDVNFANLKELIFEIVHFLFGKNTKIRFRPSYFPFTEPSAEVDILSDNGKWLEILGCGIVNPAVLKNCNINPELYSGMAFGLGVERIAMLKYGINDIRDFYKSNLDFLYQFK